MVRAKRVGLAFLKAKASAKMPRVKYAYPMYASRSRHSRQLHISILMRAPSSHVLVSYNPSFHRRVLQVPFSHLSNMLLARRRCSRANKVSSLHPFYHFKSVSVCTSGLAYARLHRQLPCFFHRILCPNIPHLRFRYVRPCGSFPVGGARVVPVRVVRNGLPVLKFHVKDLKFIASVLATPRRDCTTLRNISALIIGNLHPCTRNSRRAVSSTVMFSHTVNTHRACLVRVDRRTKLRTSASAGLPPRMRLTCSKLRVVV